MNFPERQITLPMRSRFGSTLPQEVYAGVSLLDGTLMFLPRLGHSGWVPIAKCTAMAQSHYTLTPIPPALPITSIGNVRAKLYSGTALTQVFIGSSLLANGQGTGNLSAWLQSSTKYGLNVWGSTITTETAAHGGMGPRYHAGILMGRTAELALGGSSTLYNNTAVLLRGDHSQRSGRANAGRYSTAHQKAKMGLLWLEVSANGGSDYTLFQEGCLRFAANNDIPTVLVIGNAMGETVDLQAVNALWTDAPALIARATALNIPIADAGAFMMAGMLSMSHDSSGIATYYSDTGTHPSVGTVSAAYAWPPSSGYDGYAHALASVARPAISLQNQPAIKNQYVSNPNIPLACTVFTGSAIQTNSGAVSRTTPLRSIAAAPHHVLNQFGETTSVQIPANGAVAFGVPFCNTVDLVYQGGAQDSTVTLTPSSATYVVSGSTVITDYKETFTLARLSNPPTITSRGFKVANGAEGTLNLCAVFAFQPAHEWLEHRKTGTFTAAVENAHEYEASNTSADRMSVSHRACIGLYAITYSGTVTENAVLTPVYDGVAGTDITVGSAGGYPGVLRGQKFSSFGSHEMALTVKTVASVGGTMALRTPTGIAGWFAVLSG